MQNCLVILVSFFLHYQPTLPKYFWTSQIVEAKRFSFAYAGVIWPSKAVVCKRCIHCITIGVKFLCRSLFIFQSAALSWDFWGKLVAPGSFEASQVEVFVLWRFTSSDLLFNHFISLLLHMYSSERKKTVVGEVQSLFPLWHSPKKKKSVA